MAYGGLTGFLQLKRRSAKEAALDAGKLLENKTAEEIAVILEPECQTIADLIDKAERVDELERMVANLIWRASDAAQTYRQELAAAEQRSKDNGPC